MGVTALPPGQRVTILAGRLVREGVLQQSALSRLDASCAPTRAAALADAALAVARRCQELADRGVPPATIEDQDFSALLRAKDEAVTPQDVRSRQDELLAGLDALEAQLAEPRQPGPGAREARGAPS
jgi:V/A-type H+/Na+-transporting ATPase subunit A